MREQSARAKVTKPRVFGWRHCGGRHMNPLDSVLGPRGAAGLAPAQEGSLIMAQWIRGLAAFTMAGGLTAGGFALAQGPNMNLPIFGITPGDYSPHYEESGPSAR